MSFQDKSIQCSDCGATFTHSVDDQEFFQKKGFTNEPKRCPECRQAKKSVTAVTELPVRCSPQHVPNVVKIPRYLLNLAVISQCTVVIAIEKIDRPDKLV